MNIGRKIPTKPKEYTKEELELRKELSKFKECYIFVNTNFKRKSEPIFALAFCESQRRIKPDAKNLVFKSNDEILKIISNIVKQHYIKSKGNAGIWGQIQNYAYHHIDNETYVFDTDGKVLENATISESRAILTLK